MLFHKGILSRGVKAGILPLAAPLPFRPYTWQRRPFGSVNRRSMSNESLQEQGVQPPKHFLSHSSVGSGAPRSDIAAHEVDTW